MTHIINILIGFIAILHLYILWFEMFAWETRGPKVFKQFPKDLFKPTKAMAANQGLYNGFLAGGLIWTFFIDHTNWQANISIFFLSCVTIAGIYGSITADKKIFFTQALPAIITLVLIIFN